MLLTRGAEAPRTHRWLVLLLYGVGATLSMATALLVVAPLQALVGTSGFAADLAGGFDLALWADIVEAGGTALLAKSHHLAWIIPISILWKAGASVGLLHTLSRPESAFWRGAARYLLRSLALGAIFLVLALLAAGLVMGLMLVVGQAWPGEVGGFRIRLILMPALAALVVSACTVMRDVARAAMVVSRLPLFAALGNGLAAPLRRAGIWVPFVLCVVVGSLLAGVAFVLETRIAADTTLTVAGLFAAQQGLQILMAAVIVGWYGALAAYAQAAWAPDAEVSSGYIVSDDSSEETSRQESG